MKFKDILKIFGINLLLALTSVMLFKYFIIYIIDNNFYGFALSFVVVFSIKEFLEFKEVNNE